MPTKDRIQDKIWRYLKARAASLRPQPRAASSQSGIANAADEVTAWMVREGFRLVMSPMHGRYIEGFDPDAEYQFMREGWDEPHVFRLRDSHPMSNVWGLRFREIHP